MRGLSGGSRLLLVVLVFMMPAGATAQQVLPDKPVPAGKGFGFNAPLFPPGQGDKAIDAAAAGGANHMRMSIHWRAYASVTSEDNPVPPSLSLSNPLGQPTGHGDTNRVDKEYLGAHEPGHEADHDDQQRAGVGEHLPHLPDESHRPAQHHEMSEQVADRRQDALSGHRPPPAVQGVRGGGVRGGRWCAAAHPEALMKRNKTEPDYIEELNQPQFRR